jgi:hypothetical protein
MILIQLPILAVALWALGGVRSQSAQTCVEQSKCIRFSVERAPNECKIPYCPVRICLIFDLSANNCVRKNSKPPQLDYACDNADLDQCVRKEAWNKASDLGRSVDFAPKAPSACKGAKSSNEACTFLQTNDKMCQVGKPGDSLYWTLYVTVPFVVSDDATRCPLHVSSHTSPRM